MNYSDVSLAFCHPHEYSGLFGAFLWRTVSCYPGIDVIDLGSGPMVSAARNEMALTFLSRPQQPNWFLMMDADMSAHPDIVQRLLDVADPDESPIVGGLCFIAGRAGKIEPTLKVFDEEKGGLVTLWDYPENAIVSLEATGGACLLVHRSVFVRLLETYGDHAYPFFADTSHGGHPFGEDVTFCIRARQHGFPVKVHTGIEVGHVKPYVYGSYDYKLYRERVAEIGEEAYTEEYMRRVGLKSNAPGGETRPIESQRLNRRQRRTLARNR
jgi:hypothetical protein